MSLLSNVTSPLIYSRIYSKQKYAAIAYRLYFHVEIVTLHLLSHITFYNFFPFARVVRKCFNFAEDISQFSCWTYGGFSIFLNGKMLLKITIQYRRRKKIWKSLSVCHFNLEMSQRIIDWGAVRLIMVSEKASLSWYSALPRNVP